MKKRLLSLIATSVLAISLFAGCGSTNSNTSQGDKSSDTSNSVKLGMVTDTGSTDDKSFNQGTWEGLERAKEELGAEIKYLKPVGETEADYLKEFGNLYDAGVKFMVTPGFKFETAIYKAQEKYKDAKFVLIDGAPNDGNGNYLVGENTVSIMFSEHEAGFLVGVAAAVQLKEGDLGFIGGMENPNVQRFNWGFQQGVAYANENLGTNTTIKPENVVYEGTFTNVAGGTQIAAQMNDRGVKAIFAAAGGVSAGVITEAKTRANGGEEVWVIGVDSDQYNDGVYEDGKSIVLTSAIKKVDTATFDMAKAYKEGKFPGGESLTFDVTNDGVGIPAENPNLSDETIKVVSEVQEKLKAGEIKVSGEQGNLIK